MFVCDSVVLVFHIWSENDSVVFVCHILLGSESVALVCFGLRVMVLFNDNISHIWSESDGGG